MDNSIDQKEIARFYNKIKSVWPQDDSFRQYSWYHHTRSTISKFICKHPFKNDDYILNAGAGDKDYDVLGTVHCVDIAEEKIKDKPLHTVASIEALPFEDNSFTGIICVGSVINYCDAVAAISELSRVLRPSGRMILEFESSSSYEFKGKSVYNADAAMIDSTYQGQTLKQWVFSPEYIKSILKHCELKILTEVYFHIFSALALYLGKTEQEAARYVNIDKIAKLIAPIKRHGCNVILECEKL